MYLHSYKMVVMTLVNMANSAHKLLAFSCTQVSMYFSACKYILDGSDIGADGKCRVLHINQKQREDACQKKIPLRNIRNQSA